MDKKEVECPVANTSDMLTILKERIAIAATPGFPDSIHITRQDVLNLTECGINVAIQTTSMPAFLSIFSQIWDMEGAELGIIQDNPMLHDFDGKDVNYKNFVALFYCIYSNATAPSVPKFFENSKSNYVNKFLYGFRYADRPLYSELSGLKSQITEFRKFESQRSIYVNLDGRMLSNYVGSYKEYYKYLSKALSELAPDVFCVTLNPMTVEYAEKPYEKKNVFDYDTFYRILSAALYNSSTHLKLENQIENREFWSFCRCSSMIDKEEEYPVPTEEYLRFYVFSSLGYGAKGIVYDTFCQYKNDSAHIYPLSPLDTDGHRTNLWYMIEKINKEIACYHDIFRNSMVLYCVHTGDKHYQGTDYYDAAVMPLTPFESVQMNGAGVQISLLEKISSDDGEEEFYCVMVNHDFVNFQTIKVTFDDKVDELKRKLTEDGEISETIRSFDKKSGAYIDLPPGGYTIFKCYLE